MNLFFLLFLYRITSGTLVYFCPYIDIARIITINATLRFEDIRTSVLYPEHIWHFLSNSRVSCSRFKITLIFRCCHTPIARDDLSEEVDILFTTSEDTCRSYFKNRFTAQTIMGTVSDVMNLYSSIVIAIGIACKLNSFLSHGRKKIFYIF